MNFDNICEYGFYYDHDHYKYYVKDFEAHYAIAVKPNYIPRKSSSNLKDKNDKLDGDDDDDNYNKKNIFVSYLHISLVVICMALYCYIIIYG